MNWVHFAVAIVLGVTIGGFLNILLWKFLTREKDEQES